MHFHTVAELIVTVGITAARHLKGRVCVPVTITIEKKRPIWNGILKAEMAFRKGIERNLERVCLSIAVWHCDYP